MKRVSRILTGYQVMRHLAHAGMLMLKRGVWHVYRGRDARQGQVGLVPYHVVARLEAAGHLQPVPDFPDRRVASPALPWPKAARPVRRPASIGAATEKAPGPAMERVIESLPGRAAGIRLKAAAGRFLDDFGRSARPAPVYLRVRHRDDAASRMAALQAELGAQAMQRLEDLIVGRAGLSALSQRWGLSEDGVLAGAETVLRELAAAYDLSPDAESPARASDRIRSSMEASPLER